MKNRKLLYSILISCFIIAAGFSMYFYYQTQKLTNQVSEATTVDEELPSYHFTLIGEEMDHDYWRLVGEGAKKTEQKYDVWVEYVGPRRSNPEEQLKLFDIAIKSKVDGIIVQALNDDFLPMIDKAREKGIPVITIDTDAPDSMRSTYIGTDNYVAGQLAGRALVEDTGGEATVGIVTGSFSNSHHQLRVEGFKDIVEKEAGIDIVAIEESNITRVIAEEKAYQMLTEYPDITALYGTSALDGIGMTAAADSLGMDNVYMMTFDTLPENIQLLEQEKLDVLIEQKPFEMGHRSIELMLEIMKGNQVEDVYHTDAKIVKKGNIDEPGIEEGKRHD